jgi:hypothetical protein
MASKMSMLEVDFIEELEAYTDRRQCTSLFIGISNISSYFYRAVYADAKCVFAAVGIIIIVVISITTTTTYNTTTTTTITSTSTTTTTTTTTIITPPTRYSEALALSSDPSNCHERWHFGNHYRARADPEAPVHYFYSVMACMQAGINSPPGLPHTLLEYVFETLKHVG